MSVDPKADFRTLDRPVNSLASQGENLLTRTAPQPRERPMAAALQSGTAALGEGLSAAGPRITTGAVHHDPAPRRRLPHSAERAAEVLRAARRVIGDVN